MSDRALRIVALTSAIALKKADDFARHAADDEDDVAKNETPGPRQPTSRELFRKIVVATDGTDAGARAVAYAIELAREHGATLEICTVVDGSAPIAGTSLSGGMDGVTIVRVLEDAAREILAGASARANRAEITSSTTMLSGRPAEAIVTFAGVHGADTILVGTRGHNGLERLFLGSTAWDILRASAIPTIVVSPHARAHAKSGHVLVALDDSERSTATLRFAMRFAATERARLVLCSIVETRDLYDKAITYGYDPQPLLAELKAAAAKLLDVHASAVEAHGLPYEIAILDGDAAPALVEAARQYRVDAIVIGTHGRRGVERLFLGSVAEAVVREATVPVAVIRTHPAAISNESRPYGVGA